MADPGKGPPPAPTPTSVTALLDAWRAGDVTARERLLPLVYEELRQISRQVFRRERAGHTLQPTAVVHEAYLKLAAGGTAFHDRLHFFAVASQVMRQVLVDHARARAAAKRGGGATLLALDRDVAVAGDGPLEVLAVHESLSRLEVLDPDQARLVELRFFGGLTVEETAEVLSVSAPTVKRDWRLARAFLARELSRPA